MEITVKIFGELYRYIPGGLDHAVIMVPPKASLADLLQQLRIPDYAVWVITVNDQRVPPEHRLTAGDTVAIFAPVAGG
ncbi:MAG: MoaD/ThiS family protein [Bacillota bacterium]